MAYQKLRGDHLFNGKNLLGSDAVLILDELGHKVDIIPLSEAGSDVQYIQGAILPGMVNAHCHLELSHMKGKIREKTGLVDFLLEVVKGRGSGTEQIEKAMAEAYTQMEADGIRIVGDVCNTAQTISIKNTQSIRFHNFIEMISLTEAQVASRGELAIHLMNEFNANQPWPSSLSPHAAYTVHPAAMPFLNERTKDQIITIHNQETKAENELFEKGTGDLLRLYTIFGHASSPLPSTGTTSLRSYLHFFNKGQKIILVHNTFMSEEDIIWADELAQKNGIKLYHCFCVNANLFIEDRLPNIPLFIKHNCAIVLGTDSLSSNWSLQISDEMNTILNKYDGISIEQCLSWVCNTGWELFGLKPVWITGSNLIERMQHRQ